MIANDQPTLRVDQVTEWTQHGLHRHFTRETDPKTRSHNENRPFYAADHGDGRLAQAIFA